MKKLFLVYVIGKVCNKAFIKMAYSENEACLFFESLGYTVSSIYTV
jgi:hypothetical protein